MWSCPGIKRFSHSEGCSNLSAHGKELLPARCPVRITAMCTLPQVILTPWGPCQCLPAGLFIWEKPGAAALKARGAERRERG